MEDGYYGQQLDDFIRKETELIRGELTAAEEQSKERATKAAERIKNYQRQASLDLEAMTQLRVELHTAEAQLAEMRQLIVEARKGYWNRTLAIDWHDRADIALSAAPKRGRVV